MLARIQFSEKVYIQYKIDECSISTGQEKEIDCRENWLTFTSPHKNISHHMAIKLYNRNTGFEKFDPHRLIELPLLTHKLLDL